MKILKYLGLVVVLMAGLAVLQPAFAQQTLATIQPVVQSAANWTMNLVQLNGTTVDTNSGTKSAGTMRVVLATDQPALTNKLLVTPDSVALPANQSVNVAQVAGTTTDTNSGTKSAGTIRVVIATDQPQLTNKLLVTPDSVALPANQSVNVAQMNGVTTSMNAGAADTGTQRVVVADIDPCRNQSNTFTYTSISQTAGTQLLGLAGSAKKYYICEFSIVTATAQNIALVDSTTAGNACATSPSGTDGFGGSTAATGFNLAANGGIVRGVGGYAVGASHNANAALCLLQSGAGQVSGGIKTVVQ